MDGREVSRPYRIVFFAEGCFLCFLFRCPQYLSTEPYYSKEYYTLFRQRRIQKKIIDADYLYSILVTPCFCMFSHNYHFSE